MREWCESNDDPSGFRIGAALGGKPRPMPSDPMAGLWRGSLMKRSLWRSEILEMGFCETTEFFMSSIIIIQ